MEEEEVEISLYKMMGIYVFMIIKIKLCGHQAQIKVDQAIMQQNFAFYL